MPLDAVGQPFQVVHGTLLHFTDPHCVPLSKSHIPQGRTETYFEDCDREWEALRRICEANAVTAVLMSGDFFHLKEYNSYKVRDLHFYSNLIQSFGIPWYVIPGNHDLRGSSMDNYDVSALKALIQMTPNMVNVMDQVVISWIGPEATRIPISISGAAYAKLEETFETRLPELEARLASAPGYRIGLVHTDAMPKGSKPLPGHWDMVSYDDVLDAVPSADLICGGHIHHGSQVTLRTSADGRDQRFSKPFSFGRVVRDYFATTDDLAAQHIPTCTLIRFRSAVGQGGVVVGAVAVDTLETIIPYTPFTEAFVGDSLAQVLKNEHAMEDFLSTLSAQREAVAISSGLTSIDAVLDATEMEDEIREVIRSRRRRQ